MPRPIARRSRSGRPASARSDCHPPLTFDRSAPGRICYPPFNRREGFVMVYHGYEIRVLEVDGVRVDGVLQAGTIAVCGSIQFLPVTPHPTSSPHDHLYWVAPMIGAAGVVAVLAPEGWEDRIVRQLF